MQDEQEHRSLYEEIGGEPAVDRLIDRFYERVLADGELAPFFRNTAMDRLRRMQKEFIAAALDGPVTLSDLDLAHAHHGRGITGRHFNRFVQHLLEVLREEGVDEQERMEVIRRISTYSDLIIGEVGGEGD